MRKRWPAVGGSAASVVPGLQPVPLPPAGSTPHPIPLPLPPAGSTRPRHACNAESLIPYCSFLARVVEDPSSEFVDTQDMLSRYSTLSTTHAAQEATMRKKQASAKDVRQRITELGTQGETRKLDLSSEIEAGRRRLETLAESGRELADERAGADEMDRRLVVEASQVNMSIVNLLSRCRDSVAVTAATMAGEAAPSAGAAAAAAAAGSAGPGTAAAGSRAKAAAKVLTQMRVPPPADKSRAEVQRHIEGMLEVIEQRMTDLVELDREFPTWKVRASLPNGQGAAADRASTRQSPPSASAAAATSTPSWRQGTETIRVGLPRGWAAGCAVRRCCVADSVPSRSRAPRSAMCL